MSTVSAAWQVRRKAGDVPISSLAYLGDAYYEMAVRTMMVNLHVAKSGLLHRRSVRYSKASFQATLAKQWVEEGLLSEEEEAVLRRGRNSDPGTMAKHASPGDYRWATGLEALIGYLYSEGEFERIDHLLLPALMEAERQGEETTYAKNRGKEGGK